MTKLKNAGTSCFVRAFLLVSGTTDDGEFEYTFNTERLKEVDEDLYRQHMDEVDTALLSLHTKGIIDLDFSEQEVVVSLTERGREWASALAE